VIEKVMVADELHLTANYNGKREGSKLVYLFS
jgi:hypothetical protein